MFSGNLDQAKEEDPISLWMVQARALIEEAETGISEPEKRRRIQEALKAPALNIIEDLRREKPAVTARDYLSALDIVFGSTKSGEDLYHDFISMDKRPAEKPSDFLSRLQTALQEVIQKKGIATERASQVLLKQFFRGTLFDQMLLVDLHLREQLDNPPTFLDLLSQVRKREDEYYGRSVKNKAAKAARNVHFAPQQATEVTEQQTSLQE